MTDMSGFEALKRTQMGNGQGGGAEKERSVSRRWPEPLAEPAYHGVVGRIVRLIEPHTEADPVAVLAQFLIAFGNAVGRGPHFRVEADRHFCNQFAVLVGNTSKGRKGTAWGQARRVVEMADDTWMSRITSGLSSGEGLIWQVRDPIEKKQSVRNNGRVVDYQNVIEDAGVTDKRLFVYESEFGLVLRVLEREGNKLSGVTRDAWDRGNLTTLTKNNPARATGAHISIVGHATVDELLRYLTDTEAANGFANRFLWICVRRSKVLPEGGSLSADALLPLAEEVRDAIENARRADELRRDEEARALWHRVYPALSEGRPGLLGAVLARAEAQVMRLALIYALLDKSTDIRADHLRAALAVWDYCEASTEYIFGDRLGDPVADRIADAVRSSSHGMTRTDIRDLLGRHCPAERIENALEVLKGTGKASVMTEATGGKPAERWFWSPSSLRSQDER